MNSQQLKNKIERQVKRIRKAERNHRQSLPSVGTLGLVMILPIIGAVYLGHWLDDKVEGYSTHWTISLLFAGLVIGIFNVYFLIKE
ncbi:AtpZ/AtpI family protein [Candidatus Methylobacter oryzae]|nr:AtpZ/AtpI family protein [Candidatus Methylobacter oryzae]